jgi:hypothetical protein
MDEGESFDYNDIANFIGCGKVMGNYLKGLLN